ncbi:MAG: TIGR03086 family metal-binding protein [Acidimicrobiales bacterium]
MTLDPDLAALEHASERFADAVRTIDLGDWQRPTPCEEWDVQALVDHVVGGNWFTTLILGGHAADEAMQQTMARFGDGSADVGQAVESTVEQRSAFGQPHAFEQTWHHVAGELTGRQIIRLRLHDLIAHTWDLETALGRDAGIPAPLVRWGLDELARPDSLTARFFAPPALDSILRGATNSASSTAAIEYLLLLGRVDDSGT